MSLLEIRMGVDPARGGDFTFVSVVADDGSGKKFVCTIEPGERWKVWNCGLLIAGGDKPPRYIHPDGTIEEIKLP
jgi:hypothetical protein